ncbi:MAG: FtsQ-type POTRA domain-containing protein [Lapillicoccus sp.]
MPSGRVTSGRVTSGRGRFERRARAVRRRPWRHAAIAAGVVVVLGVLGWLLLASPAFSARSVTVTGLTDPGERAAALAAAAIPPGTPLARVDTFGATARVEAIATVERVHVTRHWPSGVTVDVTRKVPVLAVKNPQGQLEVVDSQGAVFQTVTVVPAGIPLVNASTATPDPRGLLAAVDVLSILPADLRAQVAQVTVTSADLVTFTLGKVQVVWGGAQDGPKKLAILRVLLPTGPGTIDVSAPDTPTTR